MMPFFHWLPMPVRIFLVTKFELGNWKKAEDIRRAVELVESARLLNEKMVRDLFSDADIVKEKFLLFTKSFIAIRIESK